MKEDGSKRTGFDILAFPDVSCKDLEALIPELSDLDIPTRVQLERDALYAHYILRQERDVEALKRDENQILPPDMSFEDISGLSNELKAKLQQERPANLAQAARIDGMTPAALALVLAKVRQAGRAKRAL